MSLANLLTKGSLRRVATATPATFATHSAYSPPAVATVATVAVAKAPNPAANDPAQVPAMVTGGTVTSQVTSQVTGKTLVRIEQVRSEVRTKAAVFSSEVSIEVSTETAAIDEPDRWSWPISTAMTGREIETFTARLARFTAKGLIPAAAELLADRLVTRDREQDDRRLCLECAHLCYSWRCGNWEQAAVAIKARDAQLPVDLVQLLQRCNGFKEIGL